LRLRETADEYGLLLFFDEVQCGMGRTGKLFAYQWSEIEPDLVAVANGLGGGFPVGALLANEKATAAMAPGTHGSTFGGNPLAMAAANAVLDVMLKDGFFEHVQAMSAILRGKLEAIAATNADKLGEVRGLGLLMGIECKVSNLELVKAMEAKGLLTVPAANGVLRFIPPLIIEETHIDEAMNIFEAAVGEATL
jgi:acetylornithine/N-succinyldiaminopimelate aminotransferase